MKENIENKISQKGEKQSSDVISKTKEGLTNSLDEKFVKRIEFLMKLEEIESDVDDDTFRVIWDNSFQRLSSEKLRSFEATLNEYVDVLDNETLKKLYYLGFTDFVLQRIDVRKFKSDKDFYVKLFVDWHTDLLLNCWSYFEKELINWLVEAEEYKVILNNIYKFKTNTQYILNKIIDRWWGAYICENLYKHFDKIDIYETTKRMEKNGVTYKDIYSFVQRYREYLSNKASPKVDEPRNHTHHWSNQWREAIVTAMEKVENNPNLTPEQKREMLDNYREAMNSIY